MYSPSLRYQREFHNALKHGLRLDIGDSPPLYKRAIPLHVTVIFCMPRPASHFFKTRVRSSANLKAKYESEHDHIVIPDLDNLIKFVLDALVKIAYWDDNQVYRLSCRKEYDGEGECKGRTLINVKPRVIDLTNN